MAVQRKRSRGDHNGYVTNMCEIVWHYNATWLADNLVNATSGPLLTLEIVGALPVQRFHSFNLSEAPQCALLLDRIESIDVRSSATASAPFFVM